jgi:ribosomal protein L11 methyltransferase
MGFGTGHHATTRLCLAALQNVQVEGRFVLDAGTGSGILALAARALGAAKAIGIDNDADAVQNANENLALNPSLTGVTFEVRDLAAAGFDPTADVVTANLTGALLVRTADTLLNAVSPGGLLILSGLLSGERGDVVAAFAGRAQLVDSGVEDEWVSLVFSVNRREPAAV